MFSFNSHSLTRQSIKTAVWCLTSSFLLLRILSFYCSLSSEPRQSVRSAYLLYLSRPSVSKKKEDSNTHSLLLVLLYQPAYHTPHTHLLQSLPFLGIYILVDVSSPFSPTKKRSQSLPRYSLNRDNCVSRSLHNHKPSPTPTLVKSIIILYPSP